MDKVQRRFLLNKAVNNFFFKLRIQPKRKKINHKLNITSEGLIYEFAVKIYLITVTLVGQ